MDARSHRDSKRIRKTFDEAGRDADQKQLAGRDVGADVDTDEEEEAILRAAAAWSEKQTGSARVEPSELSESRNLESSNSVDEEHAIVTTKIGGSSSSLRKLQSILEKDHVKSTVEDNDEEGNGVLVCEFPSMEDYEKVLGSQLEAFDDIKSLDPLMGTNKRKRSEIMKESKRNSSRRAAIMMKPSAKEDLMPKS